MAIISIHKALASLDHHHATRKCNTKYFNPQGSREPRRHSYPSLSTHPYFNPQGSREPRHLQMVKRIEELYISIHKALASLDFIAVLVLIHRGDFNPQGSREPRPSLTCFIYLVAHFNPQGSREPRRPLH